MLHHDEYFAKYGDFLGMGYSPLKAYQSLEKEFFKTYGCRRYRKYCVFRSALSQHRKGRKPRTIVLHVPESFEIEK